VLTVGLLLLPSAIYQAPLQGSPRFPLGEPTSTSATTSGGHDFAVVSTKYAEASVFVIGSDGAVWRRYYEPTTNQWSNWASLGKPLHISALTVISPRPGGEAVFVIGSDGVVWATYSDPADPSLHNWFAPWFSLGSPPPGNRGPVQIRELQAVTTKYGQAGLFALGSDGGVWGDEFDPNLNRWGGWFSLGNPNVYGLRKLHVVSSKPDGTSLFVLGNDPNNQSYQIYSAYFDPTNNPQRQWSGWFSLGSPYTLSGEFTDVGLQAVSSKTGGVSLFVWVDGDVWSIYYDPDNNPQFQWSNWFALGIFNGENTVQDLLAASAKPSGVSLFAIREDQNVWSQYYDPDPANNPQNIWSNWFSLGQPNEPIRSPELTAISPRGPGSMAIFVIGNDGAVWFRYFEPTDPSLHNDWSGWFSLGYP
jgi:hypothetical protein